VQRKYKIYTNTLFCFKPYMSITEVLLLWWTFTTFWRSMEICDAWPVRH